MSCEDCEKNRALGYSFCIKCGQPLGEVPVAPVPQNSKKKGLFSDDILNASILPSAIVVSLAAAISIIIMIFDFPATLDTVAGMTFKPYLYFMTLVQLGTLTGTGLQIFYVAVATIAIACTIVFLWMSRPLFTANMADRMDEIRKTPAYWTGLLLGSTLLLELVINLIMQICGVDITTPGSLIDLTLEESLFKFTEAAVWEEIAFRVVLFGIPMMIAALICRRRDFAKNLLGGFGASKLSIVILLISSLIFAYAHVDGWGLWKMFPTFFGGLMLGYLYMKVGIHACIVAHMLNDFTSVWNLALPGGALIFVLIILLGLVCFPAAASKTLKGIKKLRTLPATGFEDQDSSESNTD